MCINVRLLKLFFSKDVLPYFFCLRQTGSPKSMERRRSGTAVYSFKFGFCALFLFGGVPCHGAAVAAPGVCQGGSAGP